MNLIDIFTGKLPKIVEIARKKQARRAKKAELTEEQLEERRRRDRERKAKLYRENPEHRQLRKDKEKARRDAMTREQRKASYQKRKARIVSLSDFAYEQRLRKNRAACRRHRLKKKQENEQYWRMPTLTEKTLHFLLSGPAIRPDIMTTVEVSDGYLSRMLNGLEDKGIVVSEYLPRKNGIVKRYTLTEAGEKAAAHASKSIERAGKPKSKARA